MYLKDLSWDGVYAQWLDIFITFIMWFLETQILNNLSKAAQSVQQYKFNWNISVYSECIILISTNFIVFLLVWRLGNTIIKWFFFLFSVKYIFQLVFRHIILP